MLKKGQHLYTLHQYVLITGLEKETRSLQSMPSGLQRSLQRWRNCSEVAQSWCQFHFSSQAKSTIIQKAQNRPDFIECRSGTTRLLAIIYKSLLCYKLKTSHVERIHGTAVRNNAWYWKGNDKYAKQLCNRHVSNEHTTGQCHQEHIKEKQLQNSALWRKACLLQLKLKELHANKWISI